MLSSLLNKCLVHDLGCARVRLVAESLHPRRERILRYLARRAVIVASSGAAKR